MLSDLFRSEETLGQFQRNPDSAKYSLSDEERDKLKTKDMGWLYVQGEVIMYKNAPGCGSGVMRYHM